MARIALRKNKGVLEFLGYVTKSGKIKKPKVRAIKNPEEKKGGWLIYRNSTGEKFWPVSDGYHKTKAAALADIRHRKSRDMTTSKYKVKKTDY